MLKSLLAVYTLKISSKSTLFCAQIDHIWELCLETTYLETCLQLGGLH